MILTYRFFWAGVGATLGGMATMIGTAPNAFAVGFIQTTYNIEIGFLDWMMFAVPLMLVMLPLVWFVLTRITNPVSFAITPDTQKEMRRHYHELGALSTYEKRVLGVFVVTVLACIAQIPCRGTGHFRHYRHYNCHWRGFCYSPARRRSRWPLLDWSDLTSMPWGVLLFGGGFALAAGISQSGLSGWIGTQLSVVAAAACCHPVCLVALIVFLTEITSNTATTTTFLPVIAALALEMASCPDVVIPRPLRPAALYVSSSNPAQCHCFRVGAGKHRQYGACRVLDKSARRRCVNTVGAYLVPRILPV